MTVVKDVGNKSKEFYEFVLPPIDMHIEENRLIVIIDLPGFDKKDLKIHLDANILCINAEKPKIKENPIYKQRPDIIDKKIKLPVHIKEGEEKVEAVQFSQGVLRITIPFKSEKDITIK